MKLTNAIEYELNCIVLIRSDQHERVTIMFNSINRHFYDSIVNRTLFLPRHLDINLKNDFFQFQSTTLVHKEN